MIICVIVAKTTYPETRKRLPKYLTKTEISDILDNAKKDRYRNFILLLTMWRTGLRVSELIILKKNQIKDENLTIKGKGGKDRVIPLENELSNLLGLYCDRLGHRDRLFPLSTRQVRNIVSKYVPGEVKAHPHTFRHSFAVHCLKNGMNIRSLQKIMGHESLTTTQVYLDIVGKDVKEDFEKVDWS